MANAAAGSAHDLSLVDTALLWFTRWAGREQTRIYLAITNELTCSTS